MTNVKVKWNDATLARILEGARAGLNDAATYVVDTSKALCPVKTGKLQASIKILSDTPDEKLIGSTVPYAKFVEMGTSKMKPASYLRGALNKDTIVAIVKSRILT